MEQVRIVINYEDGMCEGDFIGDADSIADAIALAEAQGYEVIHSATLEGSNTEYICVHVMP